MANWATPEEIERKRELKKKILTYTFPFLAIIIGALATIAVNGL